MAKKKVEEREPSTWGYVRKSTYHQDFKIQLEELKKLGISDNHIYKDQASGKAGAEREQLDILTKKIVRPGDTIVAYKLDRLGHSTAQVLTLFTEMHEMVVHIKTLSGAMKIDTTSQDPALTNLQVNMMALFADMERQFILERTNAGRVSGTKFGPKSKHDQAYEGAIKDFINGKGTILELLVKWKPDGGSLSEQTFYRKKRAYIAKLQAKDMGLADE
ncbi:recombinase family protein [Peribacillus frigoritolerans]|uniref:Recombinase family protein n=1 Tax=Peribacillus frigoritolerans TaxID=450367 RepID=A0AAJ1QI61_9BACI|nr:recombinase family protein [Peribacillus frigoritolerans]MDM5281919.1 recombinase family protein [Peribacillus frigoritolerans]